MKYEFFQFNYYLTEAVKRIEPALAEDQGMEDVSEDVEIDDCLVNRKQAEALYEACKKGLSGQPAEFKIPLELVIMEEFWRHFSIFLRENL